MTTITHRSCAHSEHTKHKADELYHLRTVDKEGRIIWHISGAKRARAKIFALATFQLSDDLELEGGGGWPSSLSFSDSKT